jgi:hypothetical protein
MLMYVGKQCDGGKIDLRNGRIYAFVMLVDTEKWFLKVGVLRMGPKTNWTISA